MAAPNALLQAFKQASSAINGILSETTAKLEQRRSLEKDFQDLSKEELDDIAGALGNACNEYSQVVGQDLTRQILQRALETAVLGLEARLESRLDMSVESSGDDEESSESSRNGVYQIYHDLLDIVTVAANSNLVESAATMNILELLLETQSVHNCQRLFVYLESRKTQLTQGMVPGTGKALIILRTLNDLLRRTSKATHTVFCGRILLFLSQIFPLGERSGVNLRGEFNKENITRIDVGDVEEQEPKIEPKDTSENAEKEVEQSDKMEVDPKKPSRPSIVVAEAEDGEEVEGSVASIVNTQAPSNQPEFYILFWSLQRYFSDPTSLFSPFVHSDLPSRLSKYAATFPSLPPIGKDGQLVKDAPVAAGTANLTLLREGVGRVLEVFSEASKKEKALQGAAAKDKDSGRGAGKKSTQADIQKLFFYPKFLTSKALIGLEIADGNFRKQVLIQCLILFQYLHSFTDSAKVKQQALLTTNGPVNKSLVMPFKLSDVDDKWIKDLEARVYTEISRTPNDGETFVKTVQRVLQNERNWIRWKASSCGQFEKQPVPETISESSKAAKRKLEEVPAKFPHLGGTPAISRLWAVSNGTDEQEASKVDLEGLLEGYKRVMDNVRFRREELKEDGLSAEQIENDSELVDLLERKTSIAWRTLRILSSTQLALFAKIGVMDIEKLIESMDTRAAQAQAQPEQAPVQEEAGNQSLAIPDDNVKKEESISSASTPGIQVPEVPSASLEAASVDTIPEDAASPSIASSSNKRPREESGGMEVDETPEEGVEAKKAKVEA